MVIYGNIWQYNISGKNIKKCDMSLSESGECPLKFSLWWGHMMVYKPCGVGVLNFQSNLYYRSWNVSAKKTPKQWVLWTVCDSCCCLSWAVWCIAMKSRTLLRGPRKKRPVLEMTADILPAVHMSRHVSACYWLLLSSHYVVLNKGCV